MVFDVSLLNTQHYKVHIKGKVEQPKERSSALPTPRCSSYWKGSLLVAPDYCLQLYFYLYIYIYIQLYIYVYIYQPLLMNRMQHIITL